MEIVLAIFTFFVVIIVIKGVVLVQQAEAIIIERLGRFHRVLHSGVNIIIPFFDKIRTMEWRFIHQDVSGKTEIVNQHLSRLDLRERVFDYPEQHVITKDNVSLTIDAIIYFQITDPKRAIYEIANLPEAIEKLTQTSLRNVVGGMELDECLVSRNEINNSLRELLIGATDKWGVRIGRVEIQDIVAPPGVSDTMEKQVRAERERRAKILIAEGEKRAAILAAEGSKEAEITIAEGKAAARIRVAEAEAEAISKIIQQLGGQEKASGYLIAIRYIEALQHIAGGDKSKVVFMPYEASAVLGSLGSIRELLSHQNAPQGNDAGGSK